MRSQDHLKSKTKLLHYCITKLLGLIMTGLIAKLLNNLITKTCKGSNNDRASGSTFVKDIVTELLNY